MTQAVLSRVVAQKIEMFEGNFDEQKDIVLILNDIVECDSPQ